jgi:hypothetical protein
LSASICGVYVARQEQAGLKHRLIAHDFDELFESHGSIIPKMVYNCNGFERSLGV